MLTGKIRAIGSRHSTASQIVARIHAGKWKPPDKYYTYGLEREVGYVLEPILKSEANRLMSLADE
jgi:hypothetical protein